MEIMKIVEIMKKIESDLLGKKLWKTLVAEPINVKTCFKYENVKYWNLECIFIKLLMVRVRVLLLKYFYQ